MKIFQKIKPKKVVRPLTFVIAVAAIAAIVGGTYLVDQYKNLFVNNEFVLNEEIMPEPIENTISPIGKWWKENVLVKNAFGEVQTTGYNQAIQEAELEFSNFLVKAREQYKGAIENAKDEQSRIDAKDTFDKAVADAKKIRDDKIDKIKATYASEEKQTSTAQRSDFLKEARLDYMSAISEAKQVYDKAIAEAQNKEDVANAKQAFNAAVSQAKADYEAAKTMTRKL